MKGPRHIIALAALLMAAMSAPSCEFRSLESGAELLLSVYVPDATLTKTARSTKAETGYAGALAAEKHMSSLQVWVFLHESGELIGYKSFSPDGTGLANSTVTRFAMPLTDAMFELLTDASGGSRPTVDVYAVANAASATVTSDGGGLTLDGSTTREHLAAAVISGDTASDNFGVGSLTGAVPTVGLPMSVVLTAVWAVYAFIKERRSRKVFWRRTDRCSSRR